MKIAVPTVLAATLLACSGCGPDLPDGWDGAEAIDDFSAKCPDPSVGASFDPPVVSVEGREREIRVMITGMLFRCQQGLEAYLKQDERAVSVLVQPEDMDPSSVKKCMCNYDVSMTFSAEPGDHLVETYKRGDRYGGDEPRMDKLDSVTVTVQ